MLERIDKEALRLLIGIRVKHLDNMQAEINEGRKKFTSPEMISRMDADQAYVDNAREEVKDLRARLEELSLD